MGHFRRSSDSHRERLKNSSDRQFDLARLLPDGNVSRFALQPAEHITTMKHFTKNNRSTKRYSPYSPLGPHEAPDCGVYALELDDSVLSESSFIARNPGYIAGKPCVYVGMSSLSPEERAAQHLEGTKNVSRLAHTYGLGLRMDLVGDVKRVRRNWALQDEKRLARSLRSRGYGVWQA